MKKYFIGILLSFLIISLVYVYPVSSASVQWISFPNFNPSHIYIAGDKVLLGGTTKVYDKIVGSQVNLIDMAYGSVEGMALHVNRWVPPARDSYPPTLHQYEDAPVLAIAKYEGTTIVSTLHAYYLWNPSMELPKAYGSGAGVDSLAIYHGNVYGTYLGRLYRINVANGNLQEVAQGIPRLVDEYGLEISIYGLALYKDYLLAFGTGGVFVLRDDGKSDLVVVRSYLDKDIEGKYDIGDDCINQNGYVVWKHYLVLADNSFSFLRFVDLETGEVISADTPKSVYRVAADDIYVYALSKDGKVYTFKPDLAHERLNLVWQYDFKKKATSIGVHNGIVFVVFIDGKIAVLTNSTQFTDVPTDYWAYDAIKYLASHGIISGYPDGTFRPEKSVTRAEFAKMLATAKNLPLRCDDTLPEIYKDVHAGDWYCKYITAVVKAGYMKGYGGGRFGPNNHVKKEEILTTIVRIKGWQLINPQQGTFPDVPKNHWAYPYIETAVYHHLVARQDPHITDGSFHLGVPATRSQTAVFIYRMIE